MGRSISARTGRTLDRLEAAGRDCRMGGICRSWATVQITYDRGGPIRGCERHARMTLAAPSVSDHIGPLTVVNVERY